jgi:hypothetical protein
MQGCKEKMRKESLIEKFVRNLNEKDREIARQYVAVPDTRDGVNLLVPIARKYKNLFWRFFERVNGFHEGLNLPYDDFLRMLREKIGGDYSQTEAEEERFRREWKPIKPAGIGKSTTAHQYMKRGNEAGYICIRCNRSILDTKDENVCRSR